ncbi:hypothetical protein [Alienimonas sp. DA493]|uniref:hypothetical protein n=1 Tax=Alienimonas sp. DA493 TaxID=3373605 RepID=UPI0037545CB2
MTPHSAHTTLALHCGDRVFPLSEIMPGRVSLQEPAEVPLGPASVVATVDGREHRWNVTVSEGVNPETFELRVPVLNAAAYVG